MVTAGGLICISGLPEPKPSHILVIHKAGILTVSPFFSGAGASVSLNQRSVFVNETWELGTPMFFIIQGLASIGEKRVVLFVILLLGYLVILGGNSMIIFVVRGRC